MSKLKFELCSVLDKECDGSYSVWRELRGFNEDNPDDCPVLIRADSLEELMKLVDSTFEVLKNYGICSLPVRTVKLGDNWKDE